MPGVGAQDLGCVPVAARPGTRCLMVVVSCMLPRGDSAGVGRDVMLQIAEKLLRISNLELRMRSLRTSALV